MTKLLFEKYPILAATLGEDSALPDIHVNSYIRANITVSDRVSDEDAKYIGKGMISSLLPYRISDSYTRERSVRDFNAAILENEHVRAVFLPELGGRLWSLYDKKKERELLYKNDVFQPCNLALRNAWFSGGVEWNVGIKGHNPLTCAPLFAQRLYNDAGDEILRMYEFERIRGIVYVIEATLKGDALLMNITIENTAERDTPMYWWSNIAVPETRGTRVVVPARAAFYCGYSDGKYFLDKSSIPEIEGRDVTYASSSQRSRDFFFDIPAEREKWVAAIDENGKGLLQLSDPILKGRKLFVWGQHTGGRRWNEWLSHDAGAYIEIQAGLLKTQLEHFVMDGASVINWRECYCAIDVDPEDIHGDFDRADETVAAVARKRASLLDPDIFKISRTDPISAYGSGWGALENKIRQTPISNICTFPDESMGSEQADWLSLLGGDRLPKHDKNEPITSYVVGKRWIELMESAPSEDWYYYNQLGVLRYADSDFDGAVDCFTRSIDLSDNAWARRNLAMIQKNIRGELCAAADNMLRAVELLPDYYQLTVECFLALIRAARYDDLVDLYGRIPESAQRAGRILMLLGECYSKMGDPEKASEIITSDLIVPDLMEGEYSLSNIWIGIYAQILAKERGVSVDSLSQDEVLSAYPLPREIDFRMH